MNNHTKGPWLIDTADRDICVQLPDGEFLEIASVGCMDHNGVKYWFGPESWANACLLRSAPDLLAALERLKCEVILSDVDPEYIKSHFQVHLDNAAAAIDKARGKP